jgi:hypothetical protein
MKLKTVEQMIAKMPKFMFPELDGVETLEDLLYRVSVETDLGENGSTDPRWTKKQVHQAKMYVANVNIAAQDFAREYPELVDSLNHADGSSCPYCGR